jgi:transposase
VHVAATESLTAYYLGGRGAAAVAEFGVLPGFTGVAVHDSYAVYDRYQHCRHQLCCAHLLRELVAAAEDHPGVPALNTAHDTLAELIHLVNTARAAGAEHPPAQARDRLVAQFRDAVLDALVAIPPQPGRSQYPARNLLERLHHRHAEVVRFATDGYPHVPATNNQAERDLRPTKTQQKISGRLTSEDITAARLRIRGYLSTAAKHRISALTALRTALTGHPWIPPTPA